MKLDLVFIDRTRSKPRLMSRGSALRVLKTAVPFLGLPRTGTLEVAVILVGAERIRELNGKWRKIDKPTDVLAFPLPAPRAKGYTAISLGDIFICPVMVRADASRSGLSAGSRINWALVHGLLHLAGHDHEKGATAAKKMAALERKILKKLK